MQNVRSIIARCVLFTRTCFLYPEDKEQKCGVAKSIRVKISAEFPGMLKMGGLTTREYAARQKWESLSPDEQAARKNKMAKVRSHIAIKNMKEELLQTS